MSHHPPKLPLRFLRWFCREDYLEEIEGDLVELFEQRFSQSPVRAKLTFSWQVLRYFRPEFLRSFQRKPFIISPAMFKHNILISYRGFLRNKSSFLINLLGLVTGFICSLFILLWVQDELRVDKFHENDEHLYQVMQEINMPGGIKVGDWAPGPLADAMEAEFPEVKMAVASKSAPEILTGIVAFGEKKLKAEPRYAEPEFFELFTYPLIRGDIEKVLTDKYSVVISEELAFKLFDNADKAIGKTITWTKKVGNIVDFSEDVMVSGVFETVPGNSSDQFDLVFPFEFFLERSPNAALWENDQAEAYFLLREGANIDSLNARINRLVASNRNWESKFQLVKYSSQYLHGSYENGVQSGGRIQYVWLFSIIAILILAIASINFMNLATARASIRLKEIGVKKTLGATRKQLIIQFIIESLLLSSLAFIVALVLAGLLLPQFNLITGKQLMFDFSPDFLLPFAGISFFTGLFASLYPALYLSGFDPVKVLKGKLQTSFGELWVRKGLVVFQFSISVVLILAVSVIYLQINFIQTKNLGYNRANIMHIKKEGIPDEKMPSFLAEMKALPSVDEVTFSINRFIGNENWTGSITWEGRPENLAFHINVFTGYYDFLETFGIRLKEGRTFSREFGTDTSKVILNEAAVNIMGLKDPVGKTITFWRQPVEIIGIAEDFHYQSLYQKIEPCIFRLSGQEEGFAGDHIWVRIKDQQLVRSLEEIKPLHAEFSSGVPMDYNFLEDHYQELYESETRVGILSRYFALMAIIISCLGLFGLAAFTAERRTKEIGIRKILGASSWGIIRLLSRDFTRLVLIAITIALPAGYFLARNWLNSFAYKIDLSWWHFAGAAVITLVIAWITVGFQTFRAASVNPAECLRDE